MSTIRDEQIEKSNKEEFITIIGENSGKEYRFYKNMYAVLDPDLSSPLSCVSVANNSLSIDLWTGCSLQCSYCHVQGIYEDIDWTNRRMRNKPIRRNSFSVEEIIDSLVKHPYFERDKTVLSIGTSSTEPFARGKVLESTLRIMEYFIEKGYKNPFWIVTKGGIPQEAISRLNKISEQIDKLIISICYAGNKKEIEPSQNNRFQNLDKLKLKDNNISVNWYLRPFNVEWFDRDSHSLEDLFQQISRTYGRYIDSIIPGGLRWTEGIEYGICEARNLKLPKLLRENNVKTMENSVWDELYNLRDIYFPNTPLFKHSSCGVSTALERTNICLAQYLKKSHCASSICPSNQRKLCSVELFTKKDIIELNKKLEDLGYGVVIEKIDIEDEQIKTTPDLDTFSPALRTAIIHCIANGI